MVLGGALFPIWFFQGIEQMKVIAILSLISKGIFTSAIFIFVKTPDDYLFVPLFNSLGYIFVGLISLVIISVRYKVKLKTQKVILIKLQLLRGWHIFLSKIAINLYTATNIFILGLTTNDTVVGHYGIAEKVVRIITFVFTPFNQAIYPYFVRLVRESQIKANILFIRIILSTIFVSIIIALVIIYNIHDLFYIAFNDISTQTIETFKIMSPLIIILPAAAILFNMAMLSFRMDKYFSKIYISGGILNLMLIILFYYTDIDKCTGIALALVLSELYITLIASVAIRNKIAMTNM
jgi:PST family polysaccharide transporter